MKTVLHLFLKQESEFQYETGIISIDSMIRAVTRQLGPIFIKNISRDNTIEYIHYTILPGARDYIEDLILKTKMRGLRNEAGELYKQTQGSINPTERITFTSPIFQAEE